MSVERIPAREITPETVYLQRRQFIRYAAAAGTLATTGWLYRRFNKTGGMAVETDSIASFLPADQAPPGSGFSLDEEKTPLNRVVNYNNFYEFTTDKESVAEVARGFTVAPWQIRVDGMVHKPLTLDLDDIYKFAPLEERIYRMRCVEGWSMVIPWIGFPLRKLIEKVEPMGNARYVAFETMVDANRFPGQKGNVLGWPYVEGLRMDEAMHPLTLLAVGLYGRLLPPQNGAPLRLVVPWKYGFKGIKSIVKITLVGDAPVNTWQREAPTEYGFFANVNPEVPHPRWSQATEHRLGESGRRPTLLFNGYAEQVAKLYHGMDLKVNY